VGCRAGSQSSTTVLSLVRLRCFRSGLAFCPQARVLGEIPSVLWVNDSSYRAPPGLLAPPNQVPLLGSARTEMNMPRACQCLARLRLSVRKWNEGGARPGLGGAARLYTTQLPRTIVQRLGPGSRTGGTGQTSDWTAEPGLCRCRPIHVLCAARRTGSPSPALPNFPANQLLNCQLASFAAAM
jgi:hypothetical protein